MVLFIALLLFLALCVLTFLPQVRLLYAKNPPLSGLVLTLISSFLGIYAAMVFSRSEDRRDRMARAATLMEMTRQSLAADKMEARLLSQLRSSEWLAPGAGEGQDGEARVASVQPKELSQLLANDAVLLEISPVSLKALLESQAAMEADLRALLQASGSDRRRRLNSY